MLSCGPIRRCARKAPYVIWNRVKNLVFVKNSIRLYSRRGEPGSFRSWNTETAVSKDHRGSDTRPLIFQTWGKGALITPITPFADTEKVGDHRKRQPELTGWIIKLSVWGPRLLIFSQAPTTLLHVHLLVAADLRANEISTIRTIRILQNSVAQRIDFVLLNPPADWKNLVKRGAKEWFKVWFMPRLRSNWSNSYRNRQQSVSKQGPRSRCFY